MHILAVNWSQIVHSIASIVRQFSASNLSSFFPPQFGSILIFSLEQIDKKLRAHLVMLSLNKKSEKWKRQNSFLKDAISFHVNFLSSPKISFAICSGCNIYICWKKWSSLTVSLFNAFVKFLCFISADDIRAIWTPVGHVLVKWISREINIWKSWRERWVSFVNDDFKSRCHKFSKKCL